MGATVYFSREITPEKVLELYQLAGRELTGNVAIKVHSGEKGNQNFLRPEFWSFAMSAVLWWNATRPTMVTGTPPQSTLL